MKEKKFIGNKTNNNNNNNKELLKEESEEEYDNTLLQDKSLKCLRIELKRNLTIFLYYKKYPKENSTKFPQEKSAIFFYFDNTNIDEKFFHYYISLAGQIENVEFGNYINRRGSSSKRRIINFAIVKFSDEENIENLLNRKEMQMKINMFIDQTKNRTADFSFNPIENFDEEGNDLIEDGPDEDGFVEVKANKCKDTFYFKFFLF